MKKLSILFVSFLVVVACKNVDQFRAPIEALTAEWSKAGTAVTDAGTQVSAVASSLTALQDSMMIDPALKLKPATVTVLDSIKNTFMAQVQGLGNLSTEIAGFSEKWATMTAEVDALSTGLKEGKLEGDVMAKINELKTSAASAASMVDGWNSSTMSAKEAAMKAYDAFKQTMMAK
ncbi:MAG: hypothetical protein JNK69_15595 [Saprospiraceae bacterium]|nr:hypothetical protein [Candidatus Vicinibacter proximus]MBL7824832.1 hypothetical protein [Saprospiraceae bacterium]MCC6844659.1 hypothetical protein [Saprospiraceae bacterium]HRG32509.1 hypothetical protein [Saprospiraceae bacterium]